MQAPILTFTVDCPRSENHGPRHWAAKKRQRRALYLAVLVAVQADPRWRAAVLHPLVDADRRKRRVVFTRGVGMMIIGKRKVPTNTSDRTNFAAGLKRLLDVLLCDKPRRPGLGFLVDDSPTWLDDAYEQDATGMVQPGKLLVEIFECEVTP